jgi:nucleoside diphosphate-linked moiety X motif protein 19
MDEWRKKVHDEPTQFIEMCQQLQIVPAVKHVVHWSNWITPKVEPKRFDTHFFLSVLPKPEDSMLQSSSATADGSEISLLQWVTPSEALSAFKNKKIRMFPPQFYLLTELAQNYSTLDSLKEFMEGKRRSNFDLVANCPEFKKSETGSACIVYPGDPLHSTTNMAVCDTVSDRHRLNLTMGDEASGSVGQIVDMQFDRHLSKKALDAFSPPSPSKL